MSSIYTDGANFAFGGACVLLEINQRSVVPLKIQLDYFKNTGRQLRKKLGDAQMRAMVSKAVYLMNVGSDDYILPLGINSSFTKLHPQHYVRMAIGNLAANIKVRIYIFFEDYLQVEGTN